MSQLNPYPPVELFQKRITASNTAISELEGHLDYFIALDNDLANKIVYWNSIINVYQKELEFLDGNIRTVLSEDKFDSHSNFFTSNGVQTFDPLSNGWASGRLFNGTFSGTTTINELNLTTLITNAINTFKTTGTAVNRSTGLTCSFGTPPAVDSFTSNTTVLNNLNTVITAVTNYRDMLISLKNTTNISDPRPDAGSPCNIQGQTSRDRIDIMLLALNTWLDYNNFHSPSVSTCTAFNALDPSTFPATKGNPREILTLETAIATKLNFRVTRINEVTGYLGSVTLSPMNHPMGSSINYKVSSSSGLYGIRYPVIVARMHKSVGTKQLIFNARLAVSHQVNTVNAYNQSIDALTKEYANF